MVCSGGRDYKITSRRVKLQAIFLGAKDFRNNLVLPFGNSSAFFVMFCDLFYV